MKVVEIFDSIDGEGIRAGAAVTFIRLAGCNLRCSYCDTAYALFDEPQKCQYSDMDIDEIVSYVHFDRVTLTGGEPLIHKDVKKLIDELCSKGIEVNIETNGAVDIVPYIRDNVFFTIDYKLPSSGEEEKMVFENFLNLRPKDVIKFVVGGEEDKNKMIDVMRLILPHYAVMPHVFAGVVYKEYDAARLVEDILKTPELKDVRLQLQLHKYIWDPQKRGV